MRTPRFLAPAILLLLLFVFTPAVRGQPARTNAVGRNPLWKVEGKTNAVYLLGSVHLLKAENYPLAAPIEAAFSNAQVVVFETDMAKMEEPGMQFQLLSKAGLPEGQTLKGQLSPEVYANFSKHVEDAGLMMFMFEYFKPAMAALTLQVMVLQKMGLDPEYGVDRHFFRRVGERQLVALETVEFQIGLITDFTKEEGDLLMKITLEEIDSTKKEYAEIVAAWQAGDAVKMEKLLNEAEQQAPAIYKRLVTDRNRRWVPKIEELLAGGRNTIVIVGAGHLVGSEGVVELLKKKGHKVTQL